MKQKIEYKNGQYLSYIEYGDPNGFPILIQHGLIASIDDYDLFNGLLEANARLICIARPGYGESSPYKMNSFAEWGDLLPPLLDKLQLDQFDILGISSGAPYSYSIASAFPEEVRTIFILSGIPALYDETVLSYWPYPAIRNTDISAVQTLAHELFFSSLTAGDLEKNDVRDSTMNHGLGVAQDLRLRFMDWGFSLSDVKTKVYMRHSKCDDSVPFQTAIRTAELLPNCDLELMETGPHFSQEVLHDFIQHTIIKTRSW
jgi:pimeloyl-ACP methyl ester carboxylesterase